MFAYIPTTHEFCIQYPRALWHPKPIASRTRRLHFIVMTQKGPFLFEAEFNFIKLEMMVYKVVLSVVIRVYYIQIIK